MRAQVRRPFRSDAMVYVLALLATASSLASEAGRLALKGQNYAYATFNDIHYYTAMVVNLWGGPIPIEQELDLQGFVLTPQEWSTFYGGEDPFWDALLHSENGLSHQPPWSYRILVPTASAGLRALGVSVSGAFLMIYVASAVLLTLSVFFLIRPYARRRFWAAAVAFGTLVAALSATSSGYPDLTFLAFAMLAVLYAYRNNGIGFAIAGFVSGLTRETAVLLVVTWLAISWSNRRLTWASSCFVLGPVGGAVAARILVEVPNASVDYAGMIRELAYWPQIVLMSLVVTATIGLLSPRVLTFRLKGSHSRMQLAEVVAWLTGVLFVLVSAILGLASSRMALLALPLFLAPAAWRGAHSKLWLVAAMVATFGYAAGDTLAFRANPVFGQIPWTIVALLVIGLQIAARTRDYRQANGPSTLGNPREEQQRLSPGGLGS